jgi:predicted methyltransferase
MLNLEPLDLLVPLFVLATSVLFLPITALLLLVRFDVSTLTSARPFQKAWFTTLWKLFGLVSKPLFSPDVQKVISQAHGVVLDVDSGAGDWIYLFSPARNPKVRQVLFLEPDRNVHGILSKRAEGQGLKGRFRIVAEIDESVVVDTITTVHVLCSAQRPRETIAELYRVLKPGGQWLVYEHVRPGYGVARWWQGGYLVILHVMQESHV